MEGMMKSASFASHDDATARRSLSATSNAIVSSVMIPTIASISTFDTTAE
jgi:hypothetical protein